MTQPAGCVDAVAHHAVEGRTSPGFQSLYLKFRAKVLLLFLYKLLECRSRDYGDFIY